MASGALIEGEEGDVPVHVGRSGAADVAMVADRGQRHLAMAGREGRHIILTRIRRFDLGEALIVPALQIAGELHELGLVEGELGIETAEAVVLGGDRLAVDGRELLH